MGHGSVGEFETVFLRLSTFISLEEIDKPLNLLRNLEEIISVALLTRKIGFDKLPCRQFRFHAKLERSDKHHWP